MGSTLMLLNIEIHFKNVSKLNKKKKSALKLEVKNESWLSPVKNEM